MINMKNQQWISLIFSPDFPTSRHRVGISFTRPSIFVKLCRLFVADEAISQTFNREKLIKDRFLII